MEGTGSGAIDDRVDVVSEEGPFDPAAAVDDADDPLSASAEALAEEPPAKTSPEAGAEEAAVQERREDKAAEVRAAERGDSDDDASKVALAHNPPPEPTPEGESAGWTTVDVLLDGLLVAGVALVVALLVVFARSRPKTVTGALAAGSAALAFVWWQTG